MTSPLLWSLVVFQLALGMFDILYHHELTERLTALEALVSAMLAQKD